MEMSNMSKSGELSLMNLHVFIPNLNNYQHFTNLVSSEHTWALTHTTHTPWRILKQISARLLFHINMLVYISKSRFFFPIRSSTTCTHLHFHDWLKKSFIPICSIQNQNRVSHICIWLQCLFRMFILLSAKRKGI